MKEKGSSPGHDGKGKEKRKALSPLPIVLANSIFRLYLLFLLGHPVGISEEERARGIQYGHGHWRIQDQIAVKTRFPGYVMTKEKETLRMNPFEKLRKHP